MGVVLFPKVTEEEIRPPGADPFIGLEEKMMNLQHRVQINISDRSGQKKQVLGSKKVRLPKRLLHLIFGDFCEVLVLTPGTSVRNIEIHEMRGGADDDE